MRPLIRWCVSGALCAIAFAMTWWLCERVAGVDQGGSQAIAGLVAAVILAPLGWWATREGGSYKNAPHNTQVSCIGAQNSGRMSGKTTSADPKFGTAMSDNQLPGTASGSDVSDSYPAVSKNDVPDAPRDDVPRPVNRPVIVGNVPHELQPYQHREELLAKFDRPVGGQIVHVLIGMSGVGKTHLAAEYARARINYHWRLVAWIDAENETALLSGLADIASECGLATQPDARAEGKAVRRWLEADGEGCLLVFDGAAKPETLRPFVPAAGRARILITSNEDSMARLGVRVPVDIFTPEEALAYLAKRVERSDLILAYELAMELGRLPLALAQAAAVIAADGYDAYLDRLRKEPVDELLQPGRGDPYPRGVAPAIRLALDAAGWSDDTLACRPVMEVISLLSEVGIPRALLHVAGRSGVLATGAHGKVDPSFVNGALARLAEMSLLTFSGDDREHVRAHPLVMRVVRERLAHEGRFDPVCFAVGEMLIRQADPVRQEWKQSAVSNLVDQMLALNKNVKLCSGKLSEELIRRMLRLRLEIARFQDDLGDNAVSAIHEGEVLLADTERVLGAEDRWTLYARHNLAVAYQQAGRDAKAIALHEKNLEERERILGPGHRDTCASRNNLAIAYQDVGRVSDAIALHEKNLAYRENFGANDRDTCASRNNLAIAYQNVGRISDAIALHEENVSYMEQGPGVSHPDVLPRLHAFGNAYAAGRVGDVIALHDSILADGERVIGTNYPDLLGYENNLATAYLQSGRLSDAIAWLERNLNDKERILGKRHARTQTSRNNLAVAYLKQGRNDEAIGLLEDAVEVLDPIVGSDHRTAQTVHDNLDLAMDAKARES